MINFNKKLKEIGIKCILHENLPKIPAMRGRAKETLKPCYVKFNIERNGNMYYIHIKDGPTGCESADIIKLLSYKDEETWSACCGSDVYDILEINIGDLRRAITDFNINYKLEVL